MDLALLSHQRNDAENQTPVPNVQPGVEAAREQVNRILASDTLRASEAVRRFLSFLSDKAFAGEADQLKEYSIGVDALGKPSTFDPRHDAGVRLLASRLRLKLDEYYRSEGSDDPVMIEMPRGRFKIVWKTRLLDAPPVAAAVPDPIAPSLPEETASPEDSRRLKIWRFLAIGLAMACLVLTFLVRWAPARSPRRLAGTAAIPKSSPELEALWSPLISSTNHLVLAFWNPMFARFQRSGKPDILFRTNGIDDWDALAGSPEYSDLRRLLGNPAVKPTLNYTMRGSLVSIFTLSQFFASRRGDVSLSRLDELSWQQVADNDIVLVAPATQIHQRQSALPVTPAFVVEKSGIRNLQPINGEPAVYGGFDDPQQRDGETVELISMLPGPLGRTRVVSFSGNHSSGLIGSVQSLTDSAFARVLVAKLKESSGQIPPYFQIVIKVRYRDDTPTYTSYLTHRALALKQNSPDN
jgi:hypothetical protein